MSRLHRAVIPTWGSLTLLFALSMWTLLPAADPVLGNIPSSPLLYVENAASLALAPVALVSDTDSDLASTTTYLNSATVVMTGFIAAEDHLECTAQARISIASTFASGTATITMTHVGVATQSDWQSALRAVTYRNSIENPATGTRTVTFTVVDPNGNSASGSLNLDVQPVNDRPILYADTVNAPFRLPTALPGVATDAFTIPAVIASSFAQGPDGQPIFDQEGGKGLAIVGQDTRGLGIWQYTTNAGTTWVDLIDGQLSAGNGLLLASSTVNQIRFVASGSGSDTVRLTVRAWDGTDGAGNTTWNGTYKPVPGSFGAESPYSATTAYVLLAITPKLTNPDTSDLAYRENDSATAVMPHLTVSDATGSTLASATVGIGFYDADPHEDILAFPGNALFNQGVFDLTTGILTITPKAASATIDQFQAALRAVTYRNSSENPATSQTVTFTVSDASRMFDPVSRDITITRTNDSPVSDDAIKIGSNTNVTTWTGSGTQTATLPDDAFTDPDGDSITFTVTVGGSALPSWLTFDPSTRILSGNPPPAYAGSHTLTLTANDGNGGTAVRTFTLQVDSPNDAPVINGVPANSSISYTEGGNAVTIFPNLTLSDADNTTLVSATVVMGNFLTAEDTLAWSTYSGLTFSTPVDDAAAKTRTVTISGTASLITYQTALASFTYRIQSGKDNPSARTLTATVTVSDGTSSSNAPQQSISTLAMNDAPVISKMETGLLSTKYIEEGTIGSTACVTALAEVTDPDYATPASAPLTGMSITISDGAQTGDILVYPDSVLVANWSDANHRLTFSAKPTDGVTFTAAQAETALRQVEFHMGDNPGTGTRTLTFYVADDQPTLSTAVTRLIATIPKNDPPVLALATATDANTLAYQDGTPATIFPSLTITDADSSTMSSATVQLLASGTAYLFMANEDLLDATIASGVPITKDYNKVTGTLTLTGTGATLAQFQTVLRTVTYTDSSTTPDVTNRKVQVSISDDSNTSNILTRDITVTRVNSQPKLNTTGPFPMPDVAMGITDAANQGLTIPALLATVTVTDGAITDAEGGEGIAITGLGTTTAGTWQFSVDSGATWTAVNAAQFTTSNVLCLSSLDANRIRFVPIAAGTATFTFRAWDRSDGTTGDAVLAWNGTYRPLGTLPLAATAPFSNDTGTSTITVTSGQGFIIGKAFSVPRNSGKLCISPWTTIYGTGSGSATGRSFLCTVIGDPNPFVSTSMNAMGDLFLSVKADTSSTVAQVATLEVTMVINGVRQAAQTVAVTVTTENAESPQTAYMSTTLATLSGSVSGGTIDKATVNDDPASTNAQTDTWIYPAALHAGDNDFTIEVIASDAKPGTATLSIETSAAPAPPRVAN